MTWEVPCRLASSSLASVKLESSEILPRPRQVDQCKQEGDNRRRQLKWPICQRLQYSAKPASPDQELGVVNSELGQGLDVEMPQLFIPRIGR
jgi:hypothetical protein